MQFYSDSECTDMSCSFGEGTGPGLERLPPCVPQQSTVDEVDLEDDLRNHQCIADEECEQHWQETTIGNLYETLRPEPHIPANVEYITPPRQRRRDHIDVDCTPQSADKLHIRMTRSEVDPLRFFTRMFADADVVLFMDANDQLELASCMRHLILKLHEKECAIALPYQVDVLVRRVVWFAVCNLLFLLKEPDELQCFANGLSLEDSCLYADEIETALIAATKKIVAALQNADCATVILQLIGWLLDGYYELCVANIYWVENVAFSPTHVIYAVVSCGMCDSPIYFNSMRSLCVQDSSCFCSKQCRAQFQEFNRVHPEPPVVHPLPSSEMTYDEYVAELDKCAVTDVFSTAKRVASFKTLFHVPGEEAVATVQLMRNALQQTTFNLTDFTHSQRCCAVWMTLCTLMFTVRATGGELSHIVNMRPDEHSAYFSEMLYSICSFVVMYGGDEEAMRNTITKRIQESVATNCARCAINEQLGDDSIATDVQGANAFVFKCDGCEEGHNHIETKDFANVLACKTCSSRFCHHSRSCVERLHLKYTVQRRVMQERFECTACFDDRVKRNKERKRKPQRATKSRVSINPQRPVTNLPQHDPPIATAAAAALPPEPVPEPNIDPVQFTIGEQQRYERERKALCGREFCERNYTDQLINKQLDVTQVLSAANSGWCKCRHCSAQMLRTELNSGSTRCCSSGERIVGTDDKSGMPDWDEEYQAIIGIPPQGQPMTPELKMRRLASVEHNRSVNGALSFGRLSSQSIDKPDMAAGQHIRYFFFGNNVDYVGTDLQLSGRSIYMNAGGIAGMNFYATRNNDVEDGIQLTNDAQGAAQRRTTLEHSIRSYMLQHNHVARVFQMNAEMRDRQMSFELVIQTEEQGRPLCGLEEHAIVSSDVHVNQPATVIAIPNHRVPTVGVRVARQSSIEEVKYLNGEKPYDVLIFPLLFPKGKGGYAHYYDHDSRVVYVPLSTTSYRFMTRMEFTKRVLYQRYFTQLGHLPRVAEQFTLDSFSRAEEVRFKQMSKLSDVQHGEQRRVAKRRLLDEATARGDNLKEVGRKWGLSASIYGSPANQRRRIAEGMAIVSRLGTPTLWITMTMDPKCPDVVEAMKLLYNGEAFAAPFDKLQDPRRHSALVVRVFRHRLAVLEKLLTSGEALGEPTVYIQRVCEFQKRGLIHAHLMVRLAGRQPVGEEVDRYVSARSFMPEYCVCGSCVRDDDESGAIMCPTRIIRSLIIKDMLHDCGPVTAPDNSFRPLKSRKNHRTEGVSYCKRDDRYPQYICNKGFPKSHIEQSHLNTAGRWTYRNDVNDVPDDRFVVSYSPILLLIFQCHLCVDVCTGPGAAAYLRKYQLKMPDSCKVAMDKIDTSQARTVAHALQQQYLQFERARVVSSSEASCRMLGIKLHVNSIACMTLSIHLKDQHMAIFDAVSGESTALDTKTHLLRYLNRPAGSLFDNLTMLDYYENFILITDKEFNARKHQKGWKDKFDDDKWVVYRRSFTSICRLDTVSSGSSPEREELFCLRLLLLEGPGRSFEDFKEVIAEDGTVLCFATFKDAAIKRNLYSPSNESDLCMQCIINSEVRPRDWVRQIDMVEGIVEPLNGDYEVELTVPLGSAIGTRILDTYMLLIQTDASCAKRLFEHYYPYFTRVVPHSYTKRARRGALKLISKELSKIRRLPSEYGLEDIDVDDPCTVEIDRYDYNELKRFVDKNYPLLYQEQQAFVDTLIEKIMQPSTQKSQSLSTMHYVRGEAGSGKSFAIKVLLAKLRMQQRICLPAAFMGSTAAQFDGGDTCHRVFGLSITQEDLNTLKATGRLPPSSLTHHMHRWTLLRQASLILIDEISMLHSAHFLIIDQLLRSVTAVDTPFGGKIIVAVGDFKQLTPVVNGAGEHSCLQATICCDSLWDDFLRSQHIFSQQKRCDAEHQQFSRRIGFGVQDDGSPSIPGRATLHEIPSGYKVFPIEHSIKALRGSNVPAEWCYESTWSNPPELANNSIICYTHEICDMYNEYCFKRSVSAMNAKVTEYKSTDTANANLSNKELAGGYADSMTTPEALSEDSQGLPPHKLLLAPGAVVMCMRNLDARRGLCNGTKLIVEEIEPRDALRHIKCRFANPARRHEIVYIPRCRIEKTNANGIQVARVQFPLRHAYAITVNRSQGMTIPGRVLLDVGDEVFTHAQVYVAVTRVTAKDKMGFVSSTHIKSYVYRPILDRSGEEY